MHVLYVTHYGIMEPLGQSQILPYLRGLAEKGISLDIMSFEKSRFQSDADRLRKQTDELDSLGIRWFPRSYRRGNSLQNLVGDICKTSMEIRRRCLTDGIDFIHCRSHVPALMGLLASASPGVPLLFDFRGFLSEEYVDAGLWKSGGLKYRITKALERILLKRCSSLVVLTREIREYFEREYRLGRDKIFTIPCCTNLELYRPPDGPADDRENRPVKAVYSGSVFGRYKIRSMIEFYKLILERRPGSTLTILVNDQKERVDLVIRESGVSPGLVSARAATPEQVPLALSGHDLGLILLRGHLALRAASATKTGEYLAAGLAVVAEEALGDLREILVDQGVGCLLNSEKEESWGQVVEKALSICGQPDIRARARQVARRYYDLHDGIAEYEKAYHYCLSGRGNNKGAGDCYGMK